MRHTTDCFIAFLLLLAYVLYPAPTHAAPLLQSTTQYWYNYPIDLKDMMLAPRQFSQTDWIYTAGILATAGVLFATDRPIRDFAQHVRSPTTNGIANTVQPLGHWQVMLPVVLGGYVTSSLLKNTHLQQTAALSLESMALSGTLIQFGKFATHRYRPTVSDSPYRFEGPNLSSNNNHLSLPCGDAGVAFSIASVIGHEYPHSVWVNLSAYGIASLVGLERINNNKHFASDVFIGSTIGYFTGSYLVSKHANSRNTLEITPKAIDKGVGIEIKYQPNRLT